jgi:hypothetical protein
MQTLSYAGQVMAQTKKTTKALTLKQTRFVEEYLVDLNATQAAKETKKKTRYGGVQQILMDSQAIDTLGQPSPGGSVVPTSGQVCTFTQWQSLATAKLTHDEPKHQNQAFKLAAERLIARGAVGKHNDLVWKATS